MKIAAYFQVHGIKVSGHKPPEETEPFKQTKPFKIIPLGISPDISEALKWLEEYNRDFKQRMNYKLGIPEHLNGK